MRIKCRHRSDKGIWTTPASRCDDNQPSLCLHSVRRVELTRDHATALVPFRKYYIPQAATLFFYFSTENKSIHIHLNWQENNFLVFYTYRILLLELWKWMKPTSASPGANQPCARAGSWFTADPNWMPTFWRSWKSKPNSRLKEGSSWINATGWWTWYDMIRPGMATSVSWTRAGFRFRMSGCDGIWVKWLIFCH